MFLFRRQTIIHNFSLESTILLQLTKTSRCLSSNQSEYTDSPEYPPILDFSPESVYKRERDRKLNKIKCVGTIEEKLIGINMPRYYGWSSLILKEGNFPFDFMPFVQHITRTDFIEVDTLPFNTTYGQNEIDKVVAKLKPLLQNAVITESSKRHHCHSFDGTLEFMADGELSDNVTRGVIGQINRVLSSNLATLAPHLFESEVDFDPRIEAFWRVGGFYPDNETYEKRKKDVEDHKKELKANRFAKRKIQEDPDDLVGHFIQYLGSPILQLRSTKPLQPLQSENASKKSNSATEDSEKLEPNLPRVPVVRYDPGYFGLEKTRRHGTNIPGFWPGDPNEFGLLSFHSQGHLLGRPPSFGSEDISRTIRCQAVLAGYAWLLGQASYQGFSTFHDITYPLSSTTVVTDGRMFTFFANQINTLLTHDEFIDTNSKVNVCYGLPSLQLYEKIEGNEIIGWNDKVVSLLVEAYLNAPADRENVDLKPFVDKNAQFAKDIEHSERRIWLHDTFRNLYSNRPRHRLAPEIYDWEEIYKIKFDKRPLDAKRRFFELGEDPFKRRLDDHKKIYIPKKLREDPKKKRRDTFWPDC